MVLAILPSVSDDTSRAMTRYRIHLSNKPESGTIAPSDALILVPNQRKVSPTTVDNVTSGGNGLEISSRRLRQSKSLPGIAHDLSRRLSSKFVPPTVVRRPQIRPSLCSIPGSILSSPTSPVDSTNPSSLQSRNVSIFDVSTAKTSFEIGSFPLSSSKSSEKVPTPALTVVEELDSDEHDFDVELVFSPKKAQQIIPQPTIKTVEAAANAKIFFETYYNPILAGKEAPRELRRQDLEIRLQALDYATEQYEQEWREWTLRETEHLRRLRVLKNQSERVSRDKQIPMALAGFEMVRVLGKGSFGVVRLVREKSGECRRDSVGGTLRALSRSTKQGAWGIVRSGIDWRKSFEFKNVTEVPQEGNVKKVNRRSRSTQNRHDAHHSSERVLNDEVHRGSMVNQFKAFGRSTKQGALKILRPSTDGRKYSEIRHDNEGSLPEVYAMKVIRKSDMIRNCQEGHLRAERDFLVASEKSRWVVPLIASFQDSSNLYLVMEYMIGGDFLGLLISKDRLEERKTQFYIAEMILCLEEAHRLKWIHRDVKPDNFLISSSGHLKISDFGLAFDGHWTHDQTYYHCQRYTLLRKLGIKIEGDRMDREEMEKAAKDRDFSFYLTPKEQKARSRHGKTIVDENIKDQPLLHWRNRYGRRALAKSIVGTSQYMAPEIVLGQEYDGRCDWWSIGIILYEVSNKKRICKHRSSH